MKRERINNFLVAIMKHIDGNNIIIGKKTRNWEEKNFGSKFEYYSELASVI